MHCAIPRFPRAYPVATCCSGSSTLCSCAPNRSRQVHDEIIGELGPEALVDAASVFGNFEMMNRVAEVSGIPIPQQGIDRNQDLIDRLDIGRFVKR